MLKAQASVTTPKAGRYLKALCNHFNQKVTAEYTDERGIVQFGFGYCEMFAEADVLKIRIQSETEENFERVKYVVSDHLERFSGDEPLTITWEEVAQGVSD
jgi:hypothetical protein